VLVRRIARPGHPRCTKYAYMGGPGRPTGNLKRRIY
jgi:hypothetical protein